MTAPKSVLDPKLLLIVDDISSQRAVYEAHIKARSEYRTVCLSNGLDAIAFAKEFKPDLIQLDLLMPEYNGLDTAMDLRSDPALADIPILLVSSISFDFDDVMTPERPTPIVDEILVIPVYASIYLQTITRLIANAEVLRSENRHPSQDDRKKKRVLIVTDDNADRETYESMLAATGGYRTMSFPRGEEVLAFAAKWKPDLIQLDLYLGEGNKNGRRIAELLKSDPTAAAIPILVLSTLPFTVGDFVAPENNSAFVDGYLRKPFTADAYLQTIARVIDAAETGRLSLLGKA